jgi:hypothetical protein
LAVAKNQKPRQLPESLVPFLYHAAQHRTA